LGAWACSRLLVDLTAMTTTTTPASPPASYIEAADALVCTFPPLSEEARRKILTVTARSARRRQAGCHEAPFP
jgi:hypothetical protein